MQMFVNCSPVEYNVSETVCSLNFAKRCRSVELGAAKKNTDSSEVIRLRKQVRQLQEDIASAGFTTEGDDESVTASSYNGDDDLAGASDTAVGSPSGGSASSRGGARPATAPSGTTGGSKRAANIAAGSKRLGSK
jgi:hypothetical protein